MLLYADEDFYAPVALELYLLGHDMVQEDGRTSTSDPDILPDQGC